MTIGNKAKTRFEELIKIAQQTDPKRAAPGNLSIADYDGLQMLVKILEPHLPERVVSLAQLPFNPLADAQHELGERIKRLLDVFEEYGQNLRHTQGSEFLPTFSLIKKDRDRVIKLCGDMRKIILSSTAFDEPHKKRLLNRIAAIEKQVLSEEGLFDVILGGVSDIGETLGKFGQDIKPLTDRMSEVVRITRRSTKEYDQIPAPEELKKLPAPDSSGSD